GGPEGLAGALGQPISPAVSSHSVTARAGLSSPSRNRPAPAQTSTTASAAIPGRRSGIYHLSQFHVPQALGIADHDLFINRGIELETVERLDVHRNRRKRRVACKHHPVAAEEGKTARQAIGAAEHRGVRVELLEVIQMRPLEV